ncbi:MAG: indole-3-glycerol phosphate synthase TrpC [Acidimicrobiia bacterium]
MTVLDEILAAKRDEVTLLHRPEVRNLLRSTALTAPPPRDFAGALRPESGNLSVVAEIKRRSPSKGELAPDLDPAATAAAYAEGGAACLSVLTDGPFFGGSVDDLRDARGACGLPVLRKDFVVDEVQVYETRAIGADALLLIVAALPDGALLADLHALAVDLGLAVLVEAHDGAELERALAMGAHIVGVNARDLGTFDEDLGVGERLVSIVPRDVIAIAESAIRSREDAVRMASTGFDGVLVGEMLVRAGDPIATVRELASVARGRR